MEVVRYLVVIENNQESFNVVDIWLDISVEEIKELGVRAPEDDPLYYDGYALTPEQLARLEPYLKGRARLDPDFDKYVYMLACEQA